MKEQPNNIRIKTLSEPPSQKLSMKYSKTQTIASLKNGMPIEEHKPAVGKTYYSISDNPSSMLGSQLNYNSNFSNTKGGAAFGKLAYDFSNNQGEEKSLGKYK